MKLPQFSLGDITTGMCDKKYIGGEQLTRICLVDYAILMNWTSSFPILGASGVF